MLKMFEKILGVLVRASAFVGVISLVAMMGLTVVTVVFRAVGIAFPGTYVLSELLLIPTVSFALAYAAWTRAHTRVELLTQTFQKRLSGMSHGLTMLLGAGFWGFVAYATYEEVIRRSAQGELSPILDIPVAPFRWLMFGAISLLIAVTLLRAVQEIIGQEPSK
ncbi:TRAP transporter small permease [Roseibium sp.]|uniref:TRAP transporter small permease n=1 Tax=Roseibium sp. TaxID=1936156 RepID=UPI003A975268